MAHDDDEPTPPAKRGPGRYVERGRAETATPLPPAPFPRARTPLPAPPPTPSEGVPVYVPRDEDDTSVINQDPDPDRRLQRLRARQDSKPPPVVKLRLDKNDWWKILGILGVVAVAAFGFWRDTTEGLASRPTRDEVQRKFEKLDERMNELTRAFDRLTGALGQAGVQPPKVGP